jgi:hypothetical protein
MFTRNSTGFLAVLSLMYDDRWNDYSNGQRNINYPAKIVVPLSCNRHNCCGMRKNSVLLKKLLDYWSVTYTDALNTLTKYHILNPSLPGALHNTQQNLLQVGYRYLQPVQSATRLRLLSFKVFLFPICVISFVSSFILSCGKIFINGKDWKALLLTVSMYSSNYRIVWLTVCHVF